MTMTTFSSIDNFPFSTLRAIQEFILKRIDSALASNYRYIILEAPTGTGKSPVGIAVGLTQGFKLHINIYQKSSIK